MSLSITRTTLISLFQASKLPNTCKSGQFSQLYGVLEDLLTFRPDVTLEKRSRIGLTLICQLCKETKFFWTLKCKLKIKNGTYGKRECLTSKLSQAKFKRHPLLSTLSTQPDIKKFFAVG